MVTQNKTRKEACTSTLHPRSWLAALSLTPLLDEQRNGPVLTRCHMGYHPTFTSHMWLGGAETKTRGVIDLGWWRWSTGVACRIQSRWSGAVTRSPSAFPRVFYQVPITWEIRDYQREGRALVIFHPWPVFPIGFYIVCCVYGGLWQLLSAPTTSCWNTQSYQHCIYAPMQQKREIGHFQSIPPLWVSRPQVITVNCWICWWGEHYNHVVPDKAVLKQTKSYPLPHFSSAPRVFDWTDLYANASFLICPIFIKTAREKM